MAPNPPKPHSRLALRLGLPAALSFLQEPKVTVSSLGLSVGPEPPRGREPGGGPTLGWGDLGTPRNGRATRRTFWETSGKEGCVYFGN